MDVLQHDYYFWRIIHHYVVDKGFRVLEQQKSEIWLEDELKPHRLYRIVRMDVDWSNWLRQDVHTTVKRFELVRRQLRLSQIEGENMYVSLYPPVDSWEEIVNARYASHNKKTIVHTTLIPRHGSTEMPARELSLPPVSDKESVEELEQAISTIQKRINEVKKEREEKERSLFSYGRPVVTYMLLLAVAVMFYILEKNGGSTKVLTLIEFGAKYNPLILTGEWWRLVSSMFLHIGFLHLMMNSLALYYLGGAVERMYGTGRFIIIYLIAGLIGSIASFAFNAQVAAGASGAIFGCFGALLYFGMIHKKLFLRTMGKSVFMILGINLVFGFTIPMIDNGAHIGGLIGGFLASAIVHLPKHKWSFRQVGAFVLTGVAVTLLLWYGIENDEKEGSSLLQIQIGQEYLQKSEFEKAYPMLREAVEKGAEVPEATFLLAYAEANLGKYEEAKVHLLETIHSRADFHEAHYNLALIYAELGQIEEAKNSVSKAITLKPDEELYLDLQKRLDHEF
ncbi:rhomboid family intramembrane serine protease [bacterium LRH843]|nr:rhomboid family intramembrane serine protease [bacterium LRH843]